MAYQSVSFDPDSVASTSDVASSAVVAAAAASDVASAASVAAAKGSDASSKIAAKSATWDKASTASSVALDALNLLRKLDYDAQTGSFTVGNTVNGGTSGATATIVYDDNNGATGTLYLSNISGTFQDDEIIYEASYGSELVTDGDCSTDSFTAEGNWAYDGTNDEYDCTAGSGANLWQDCGVEKDKFYKSVFTVKNYVSGTVRAVVGSFNVGTNHTADGTYTDYIHTAHALTNARHNIQPYINLEGSVDDISLKQVTNAALANGALQNADLHDAAVNWNKASTASSVAVDASNAASAASSKIAAKSTTWDKASAASSAVALKKATLYDTTPADTVDDGFTGSFVASGVLARGNVCYIKTTGAAAKANAASGATASGLLVMSPGSVADASSFAAIMPGTMVGHSAWNWSCGKPIFMGSSAGSMTQTKPSAASAIVRVVGYGGRNSNVIWFDPDKTWIEV